MSDEESEGNATLVATDKKISVSSEYLSQLQATEVELDACFDRIESLELRVEHLEVNRLYLINQLERSSNTVSNLKLSVNRLESENGKLRHEFINLRKDYIHLKKDNIDLRNDNIDLRNDITHIKKDSIDLKKDNIDLRKDNIDFRNNIILQAGELKAADDLISNQGSSIEFLMKESKNTKRESHPRAGAQGTARGTTLYAPK